MKLPPKSASSLSPHAIDTAGRMRDAEVENAMHDMSPAARSDGVSPNNDSLSKPASPAGRNADEASPEARGESKNLGPRVFHESLLTDKVLTCSLQWA